MASGQWALAVNAVSLPLENNALVVYSNTGAPLLEVGSQNAPAATTDDMIRTLQDDRESTSYQVRDGSEWRVHAMPLHAAGSVVGAVVFVNDFTGARDASLRAGGGLFLQSGATVLLATLILIGMTARFRPRLLLRGKWALVKARSARTNPEYFPARPSKPRAVEMPTIPVHGAVQPRG